MTTKLLDEYQSLLDSAAKGGDSESTAEVASISISPGQSTAITPSDTLLVIDMQIDFLPGGSFGVAEGDHCLDGICELMGKFNKAGATVIATREYHPKNHCSFLPEGGPFPVHCVQGTEGSLFHPKIADTLQPLLADHVEKVLDEDATTHVVYKGISKDIESFGGFKYTDNHPDLDWKVRLSKSSFCSRGGSYLDWTGAFHLSSSNLVNDANAPPDVLSVFDKKPVSDLLPESKPKFDKAAAPKGRTFVCGLAFDFCVIDSAFNYCEYAKSPKAKENANNDDEDGTPIPCYIVQDLTRAAHIPGIGQFGSGFLTDPKVMLDKMKAQNIGLVRLVD